MIKNKDLKLDKLDKDLVSFDLDKSIQSIPDNNINNNFLINITENAIKPEIRKTKTSKCQSAKKQKSNKKNKSLKKIIIKIKNVKFKEKLDIAKVECWKQYNLEQNDRINILMNILMILKLEIIMIKAIIKMIKTITKLIIKEKIKMIKMKIIKKIILLKEIDIIIKKLKVKKEIIHILAL